MLVTDDICIWSDSEVDSDESDAANDSSDQSDDDLDPVADCTRTTVIILDNDTVAGNTIAATNDVESCHGQKG